jgi:hypothetical protein
MPQGSMVHGCTSTTVQLVPGSQTKSTSQVATEWQLAAGNGLSPQPGTNHSQVGSVAQLVSSA